MAPDLPEDILRLVLEFAAYEDRRAAANTLSLVSKVVKLWVEKIAYAIIILHRSYQVAYLSRTFHKYPRLPPLVRALALPDTTENDNTFLHHLLSSCKLIKALYWTKHRCDFGEKRVFQKFFEALPLQILYVSLEAFYANHLPLSFNKDVTHLGFTDAPKIFCDLVGDPDEQVIAQGLLEGLSHLAFRVSYERSVIPYHPSGGSLYEGILRRTKNLKACVAYVPILVDKTWARRFCQDLKLNMKGEGPHGRVVIVDQLMSVKDWLVTIEERERSEAFLAEIVVKKRRRLNLG